MDASQELRESNNYKIQTLWLQNSIQKDSKHILQCDFTTLEQSKLLLELGLPADSANFCRFLDEKFPSLLHVSYSDYLQTLVVTEPDEYTPCWSSGRLMEIFDICYVGSRKNDEWPKTNEMSSKAGSIVNYIVGIYEIAAKENGLDFSKFGGEA